MSMTKRSTNTAMPGMTPDTGSSKPDADTRLELSGSISFGSATQSWGSQRRMALLRAIDEEGSISAGAKKIGLSYKAAWDAVDTMNNLAGEALVERTTGGLRGGGATLTPRARSIVTLYQTLNEAHERFISQLAELAGQSAPDLDLIRHLMVQTSARNKLKGTIRDIAPGTAHDIVAVNIGGKDDIVAHVSRSSIDELALQPGLQVLVFIDASAVMIGLAKPDNLLSARNQFKGRVERITTDDTGAEIGIRLDAGPIIASQVTPEAIESLALGKGREVYAIFKASSVMLGLASS